MRYLTRFSLVLFVPFLFLEYGAEEIKFTEGIQPGCLAPGINLQGVDLKGDGYVLLHFWAAYDPQSRLRNTLLHNAVVSGKTVGLRLISVSLDEKKSVFDGVVRADHLDESTQFHEPGGQASAVFKAYRLKNGFGTWLIDPD
jgi:hypothetical protein